MQMAHMCIIITTCVNKNTCSVALCLCDDVTHEGVSPCGKHSGVGALPVHQYAISIAFNGISIHFLISACHQLASIHTRARLVCVRLAVVHPSRFRFQIYKNML